MELLDRAAALGYDTLALTDRDNLHGAMEFARAARERGIRPITGAEITLTTGHHLTLLVESPHGYANLCRLISAAHEGTMAGRHGATPEPEAPSLTAAGNGVARPPRRGGAAGEQRSGAWDALGPSGGGQWPVDAGGADDERPPARQSDAALDPAYLSRETTAGLIALSGCRQGEIAALVQAGRHAEAEVAARRYRSVFSPGSFYVELQQNLVYGDTARNVALVDLADHLGIEIVATNNVHYHLRERARLHDVLVAIRHLTTLDASHRVRRANAEFFLKPPAEMAALFRRSPRALRATRAIAERCAGFDLTRDLRYAFPDYGVPPGQTPDQYLRHVCERALPHTYGLHERALRREAEERLEEELRLIAKHNLAGFFLTYRDILTLAGEIAHELRGRDPSLPPEERPVGRGRGSSVSSLVCHLIGLSHVDPVRNRLFLGRFLNDELASVPDIDLDFPRDIRAALIERMYDRYPGRVGLVCILPTYRLRSAIRDVGKALGLPAIDLETIPPGTPTTGRAPTTWPRRWPASSALPAARRALVWRDLIDLSGPSLPAFPATSASTSAAWCCRLSRSARSCRCSRGADAGALPHPVDKDSADDARFVKIDFLALGMLSSVDECLDTDRGRTAAASPCAARATRIRASTTASARRTRSASSRSRAGRSRRRPTPNRATSTTWRWRAIIRPGPIASGAFRPYMDDGHAWPRAKRWRCTTTTRCWKAC
ncbi:MAG: PHP domain-containing protein [Dehalococcoidia bacterium]